MRVYPGRVGTIDTALPVSRRLALVRRLGHWLGTLLIAGGVLVLVWAFVVWRWNDPFTALYTHWKQSHLSTEYRRIESTYKLIPASPHTSVASEEKMVGREAARYRRTAAVGKPIGRIVVPRLGLNMILVNGTDHDSLMSGPGRDSASFMPGQGELVYIAGHRTTYLAPFSHIDAMQPGDLITLKLPYATFVYKATGHEIVAATDLSVLRSHHHEILALQACHPRFFATHRYIVWAKLVRVGPRQGQPYVPTNARGRTRTTTS
jgi:sortase A